MIEIIKICSVRYDTLIAYSLPPQILYTFVQNNNNDPKALEKQVVGLRTDVIAGSDSKTIE